MKKTSIFNKGDVVIAKCRGIPFKARITGRLKKDGRLMLNAKEFEPTASGRFFREEWEVEPLIKKGETMKEFTKKQIKEYLSKSSLLCPFCGIQDVEFEEPEWVDAHECIQRAECLSCKQIWMFFYKLTDIIPIEREEEEKDDE